MNYIDINEFAGRLKRHPMLEEITFEAIVEYVIDFMRILGVPKQFLEKTAIIDIEDGRGELPCDFYEMLQVRDVGRCDRPGHAFRYSTDSFHMSKNGKKFTDPTYKLQGNYIFIAPAECGKIEIAYYAIPVNEDGYPQIPDTGSFLRALSAYIKREWFNILFDRGKIPLQVLTKADQEYAWAVGQCQTDLIMPSIDQMQSISNMLNNLLDKAGNHKHGFIREGTQEHIITH